MREETYSFLHIGKTGGSAIKFALKSHMENTGDRRFRLHSHRVSFRDVLVEFPKDRTFFVVRDPVCRFVSGFNSRLRKGYPARNLDWRPPEQEVFALFRSPNELAESLSDDAPMRRGAARLAMYSVTHVSEPLRHWLRSVEFLDKRVRRIAFIGWLPRLSHDVPELRRRLQLPDSFDLPSDDVLAHKTPAGFETTLSERGRRNIEAWYEEDARIVDWCLRARERLGLTNG